MKEIFIVFIFSLLAVSCFSSDGILDAEDCRLNRENYKQELNGYRLMLFFCLTLPEQERIENSACQTTYVLFFGAERPCGDPGISFPWFDKDYDKKF